MNTERNILIAFLLNLIFSFFEFIGGTFFGSISILSDAFHDIGDSLGIGMSYLLERKSKKEPNKKYTYGYVRYSVIGGLITTVILLLGSVIIIYNAVKRIIEPVEIDYNGMILFAIIGVCVNLVAAYFTRERGAVNQRAVNLHMLEDVLSWSIVLIGAIVMHFTDFVLIDPLMSIGVSIFILVNAIKNLKEILDLFLEKVPDNIDLADIEGRLNNIDGVKNVHHIHIWSMDGNNNFATMHVVTDNDPDVIKAAVREELKIHSIVHTTIEIETSQNECCEKNCHIENVSASSKHHHHQHKHHLH